MFERFLESNEQYAEAERFWAGACARILRRLGVEGHWEPWFGTRFSDGTPCRDGNPICSRWSERGQRGFKVVLQPSADHPAGLCVYFSQFGGAQPMLTLRVSTEDWALRMGLAVLTPWLDLALSEARARAMVEAASGDLLA